MRYGMRMTHALNAIVASEVRAWMARTGRTQADLAHAIGKNQSAVSQRLNGQTKITVEELGLWAELFDVPPSEFLAGPSSGNGVPAMISQRRRASFGYKQRRVHRSFIVPPPAPHLVGLPHAA